MLERQKTGTGPDYVFFGLPGRRVVACKLSFFAVFFSPVFFPTKNDHGSQTDNAS